MKLLAIAIAVSSATTLAVAEPRRDLELARVAGRSIARQLLPPSRVARPAGASGLAESRILYLNKDGVTVQNGANDSRLNRSSIPSGTATIPPWNVSPTVWSDTVACVRDMFARFEVQVVESDPGNVPHLEGVFGGTPQLLGVPNSSAVSPFTADCSVIESSMVFVFTEGFSLDARTACETMSQMIGSSYGLDHELLATDTMSALPITGPRAFQDQTVSCGEDQPRPCGLPRARTAGRARTRSGCCSIASATATRSLRT